VLIVLVTHSIHLSTVSANDLPPRCHSLSLAAAGGLGVSWGRKGSGAGEKLSTTPVSGGSCRRRTSHSSVLGFKQQAVRHVTLITVICKCKSSGISAVP